MVEGDDVTRARAWPAADAPVGDGPRQPDEPEVPREPVVPEGWEEPDVPEVPGYELGAVLARGGTSEVWAGVALDDGRRVAVKVVHADLGSVEAAAREAAVSAGAASAHVVAVEACVELADGRVAVVMPHLLGGALDTLVRARGHLSPGEVVTVLAPVASALGRLHDLGVVHGDVSPGNVLLDLDGRPVLGDLGLGHVVGDVSPGVWGTDGYVAPEVLMGGDPTPASDVYALGALGWLCLSGTVPGPPGLRPELAEVSRAGEGAGPLVAALASAVSAQPDDRPGAHELAWLLFGAAEAEPLHLVHGDDEVSAVTFRLRAAAARPPAAARVPWWRRCSSSRVLRWSPSQPSWHPRAGRAPAARHARTEVRRGWGGIDRRCRVTSWAPLVATVVLVPVLVALLVLTVAGSGRAGGGAAAPPPTVAPGVAGRAELGAGDQGARSNGRADDPRLDVEAPRSRPAELLSLLADARAAAWREATPALLGEADAPRSAAAAHDAAAVAQVAAAGVRYTGLRYSVAEVTTVAATPERAVLRARIDAGAYAVTTAAASTPRPAMKGAALLVDLVRTDVGWRVCDLRPVP